MKYKILPFFLPHFGCPYQCVFCDQKTITGHTQKISIPEICQAVEDFSSRPDTELVWKEIAFYGSSFTAIPERIQRSLLEPAFRVLVMGKINGIRISTRPDCCDTDTTQLLRAYRVKTVELGVQSLDPVVLQQSGRGHGPEVSIRALKLLKDQGFHTGVQLMPGLPGEDRASFMSTIQQVVSLQPDFVRLYPTIVIKGTPLEKRYQNDEYTPLSLSQAIHLCRDGIKQLREAGIKVIRCGLQSTPSLQSKESIVAGPYHPAFGELVDSAIVFDHVAEVISKIRFSAPGRASVFILSSPRLFSKLKGQKGENLKRFTVAHPELKIVLKQDASMPDNVIRIFQEPRTNYDIARVTVF